ncbi:MAG: hypothetical protein U1E21_05910 [Reyranellaceae bacterium]
MSAVDVKLVRILAQQLKSVAGDTKGDFVFAVIDARVKRGDVRHYTVANAPGAANRIVSLVADIGAKPHKNVYFTGSLFKMGSVAEFRGRTKDNVIGVLCAVTDFDAKNDPATRHARLPLMVGSEVETSPGNFQCHYWFDRPYPGDEIEPVLRAVAKTAEADDCKSVEHLWRVPGTLNWPNEKKVVEGRSPEPFMARWELEPDARESVTLDALRDALPCVPAASVAAQEGDGDFDWSQRTRKQEPLSREEIEKALSEQGDRSESAFKLIRRLRDSGYTPEKAVAVLIDNAEQPVMGHYGDPVDETRVRKDVQRAYDKLKRAQAERLARLLETAVVANTGDRTELLPQREIKIEGGKGPDIADQAEQALFEQRIGVFQYGGRLVCPARQPVRVRDGKEVSDLVLVPVTLPAMRELLTRAANFMQWDARKKGFKAVDCPRDVADALLARGAWKLRTLTGLISAPTLREDGSVLDQPGYDAQTGLLYDPHGVAFPPIPDKPTREDAVRALKTLAAPIRGFPFATPEARAVALSAMLTACIRRTLPTAPLFAIDAPVMGTGKSKLADTIATIASGRPASAITAGGDEVELDKRASALLMRGDPVVCIDNIDKPLESAFLCSALTQETQSVRILGQSKAPKLPMNCLFLATGNGLTVSGDMQRRVLFCLIDPKMERPSERTFNFNPVEMVKQDRGRYVTAALTIFRAYQEAGRPEQGGRTMGSFEVWCRTVRDALMWLDEADAVLAQQVLTDDPAKERFAAVLIGWNEVIGTGKRMTLKETAARALDAANASPPRSEFLKALSAVAPGHGQDHIDLNRLGYWLRDKKRQVIRDLRLLPDGTNRAGTAYWRLEPVAAQQPASQEGEGPERWELMAVE